MRYSGDAQEGRPLSAFRLKRTADFARMHGALDTFLALEQMVRDRASRGTDTPENGLSIWETHSLFTREDYAWLFITPTRCPNQFGECANVKIIRLGVGLCPKAGSTVVLESFLSPGFEMFQIPSQGLLIRHDHHDWPVLQAASDLGFCYGLVPQDLCRIAATPVTVELV
jgi:hypothetical protein